MGSTGLSTDGTEFGCHVFLAFSSYPDVRQQKAVARPNQFSASYGPYNALMQVYIAAMSIGFVPMQAYIALMQVYIIIM